MKTTYSHCLFVFIFCPHTQTYKIQVIIDKEQKKIIHKKKRKKRKRKQISLLIFILFINHLYLMLLMFLKYYVDVLFDIFQHMHQSFYIFVRDQLH
jgi:hypothetical protein